MARVAGARYTRFMARILDIADAKARAAALDALAAGDCVAIPTETVYGLAADATNGRAVAKIFAMKGRPGFNPLICHVSDIGMAREHGEIGTTAALLAEAFWPGPLTLVVPRRQGSAIHDLCTAGLDTVGLRCPVGVSRDLIAGFGRPLAAPSANRSGRISTTTAAHVAEEYPGDPLIVLDAGPCRVGLESTIVKVGEDRLTLLRPGAITRDDLEGASGLPVVLPQGGRIEAPGMLESHYAPQAPLRAGVRDCPPGAALLAFGKRGGREGAATILNLSEAGDLTEAAANLYAMLKALDAGNPTLIAVEPVPEGGLGAAINDRIRRAAAPRPSGSAS